jgi:4-hydroxybenzoate polyprenyltransferase/phosphoglycolate phosphatase-like HAD superfamily hydrolase
MNAPTEIQRDKTVLFVDLDGTLIASDVLWEALVRALRSEPWVALLAPLWLLRGRAYLKQALSERARLDAATLPYRPDVLAYLAERRQEGCHLVLASATDRRWAEAVCEHLGLFESVLASDGTRNLKGKIKLAAIEAYCREHGYSDWGYVGDSNADLPIWAKAHEIHVAYPSAGLLQRIRRGGEPRQVFGQQSSRLRAAIKAMRPHQWVKNVLLLVPLLLARQFTDPLKLLEAGAAFVAFSLCASSVYVMNDLLDIEADRLHPRNRKRPFAASTLPLAWGPPLTVALVATAFTLAALVLLIYMVANTLYSAVLKTKLMVDVLILAGLYTLRIFAGGVATGIAVSEWLLAFSIFMFTSLAFAKRYVEMARLAGEGKTEAKGRGYQTTDLSLIESIGPTSGYLAVLVFALYIHDGVPAFYTNRYLLWLTCPLLLYWISRLWFLAKRDQLHDDPVVYAVTDKVSLGVGGCIALLVLLAAPLW